MERRRGGKVNKTTEDQIGSAIITFFTGIKNGIIAIKDNLLLLIVFVIITLICGVIFYFREMLINMLVPHEGFHMLRILIPACLVLPILLLFIFGTSKKQEAGEFDEMFAQIKFCNKAGTYPQLLKKTTDGKKTVYAFKAPGLKLIEWRVKKNDIEAALDCNIVKFEQDLKTKQIMHVHAIPTSEGIPENLEWNNKFIREKDFEITVGQSLLDEVHFNFDKYPHALIAGVTGSGKSVVLRCMAWQFIKKGAVPYLIDFKGGVELADFEDFGEVIIDRASALEILKELTREMKLRLAEFKAAGVKNLTEYNKKFPDDQLCRIVIVCDEISEMLDKTGLAKADAAIYYEIEKELSSLARLARGPGINMLLATQRPDAKVIVGQIKNNLPIRISGRMIDTQASEMVLGNTKAADLGEILGRFLYSIGADTYEFQAYNFKDDFIKKGNYQIGGMLIHKVEATKTDQNTEHILEEVENQEEDNETLAGAYETPEDDNSFGYKGF